MINIDFNKDCTGCSACADVCPRQCINITEDKDGFMMPLINKANCIDCGRCEQICPVLNYEAKPYEDRKCYVAYHKDAEIRHNGSSGSVFYALAENVIRQNGVVYAASMVGDLTLRHTRATDMQDVLLQMKSKYLQSNACGIYRQVLNDLRNGKQVLFVGTPCQCQALHNMVSALQRNSLILVDMICHGVPSQSLFDKSIAYYEKTHNCKVTAFSFREKTDKALRSYKMTIHQNDGHIKEKTGDLDEIPFCMGYFNHITQRKSCYHCKQRGIDRVADLTLGDFWGLEKIDSTMEDFQKGYSSVIVNSSVGESVLHQLKTCAIDEIPEGVSFVVDHNHAYTKPDKEGLMRWLFFLCLRQFGYDTCEKHFLQQHPHLSDRLLNSLVIRIDRILSYKAL